MSVNSARLHSYDDSSFPLCGKLQNTFYCLLRYFCVFYDEINIKILFETTVWRLPKCQTTSGHIIELDIAKLYDLASQSMSQKVDTLIPALPMTFYGFLSRRIVQSLLKNSGKFSKLAKNLASLCEPLNLLAIRSRNIPNTFGHIFATLATRSVCLIISTLYWFFKFLASCKSPD